MIALDESTLSILETKNHLKTKSNGQGIQRVIHFLQQQRIKEKNVYVDTSSMLRSKRQIYETRKQEILDGLDLERNRIGMAQEDAKTLYYNFSEERIRITYLTNVFLQKQEMTLVHAKNKWLLRATTDFAKQIMEDVAAKPCMDDLSSVELNTVIYSCQTLTKQILQKRYIQVDDLDKIRSIAYFTDIQLESPLFLYSFFQFFIVYLERQAVFLLQVKDSPTSTNTTITPSSSVAEKKTKNKHNIMEPQEYLVYLEVAHQVEVIQLLIPIFFPLLEIALQRISVDEVLQITQHYAQQEFQNVTRSSITHLTEEEEEILTVLSVLIPPAIHALECLLHILLELLSKLSSTFTDKIKSDKTSENKGLQALFSAQQIQIINIILMIWKYSKSNIINPIMKWINLCIEYSFGNNTIFTILSRVLIGQKTLRANLLSITHQFYHSIILINPLLSYLKEQQRLFQIEQMKQRQKKQQHQQSLNLTTAGLRKTMMRNTMKQSHSDIRASLLPPGSPDKRSSTYMAIHSNTDTARTPSSNNVTQRSYQPPAINPIFEFYESANNDDDDGDGGGLSSRDLFQIKFQFDQFVLNHIESLITIALEFIELIINQNSIHLGSLGNISSLCIIDPYYYQIYDHEIIYCMNIVTDFYSREIINTSMILENSYYYNDGIDSCLLIIKQLTLIIQHRYCSIFVCMGILKTFLAAIGFYVNYYHLFSFDEKDYSIYQDAMYNKLMNQTLQKEEARKEEVKHVRKQLRQRTEGRLDQLSSTVTDPANINHRMSLAVTQSRKKRNAFAMELGQFSYRVLGILMLHHSSLNICHKGLLYLRYAMREQFLEKHIIEDLFSLPLQTMIDPWLASLALGIDNDDEEDVEVGEAEAPRTNSAEFSRSNTANSENDLFGGEGSYEMKSSPSHSQSPSHHDKDDQSVTSFATQDSKLFPATKNMPATGSVMGSIVRFSPTPSVMSIEKEKEPKKEKDSDSVSIGTSVTTRTNDLNPAQYLLRMKKLYIPKTFKGESNIKKHKSQAITSNTNTQDTMTLMDILVYISENHIQSNEVMEQLLLIVYHITMKSNLIKYLLVENNLPIAIQRFSDNQLKSQSYIIALSELCLEALHIS